VPVGAILPLLGTAVPAGWGAWTLADGKFLKGTTTSTGDTGGAAAVTPPTLDFNAGTSPHSGGGLEQFFAEGVTGLGGTRSTKLYTETVNNFAGSHIHTITPAGFNPSVFRTERKFIIKTGTASSTIPSGAIVFGLSGIIQQSVARLITDAERTLKAATTPSLVGLSITNYLLGLTSSQSFSHDHWTVADVTNGANTTPLMNTAWNDADQSGPSHQHSSVIGAAIILRALYMPFYAATIDYKVSPGFIFGWEGSLVSLPADYTLCNGLLGTPNVEDYFLTAAAMGQEGLTLTAASSIRYTGQTGLAGQHEHKGTARTGSSRPVSPLRHGTDHIHNHNLIEESQEWEPPYYTLAFIMYNPVPVVGFADVLLQIQGGEADGATVIKDVSTYDRTATVAGGAGTLAYTNSQLLFGMTTIATDNHLVLYTGVEYPLAFTLECFYRIDSVSAGNMILASNYTVAGTGRFRVRFNDSTNSLDLIVEDTIVKTGITVTANDWFYFSVSYDGAAWYFHTGMVSTGIATLSGGSAHADAGRAMQNNLRVNGANGNGYFSRLRLTGGSALNKKDTILIPESPFKTA
jgi:hypothetical protein